MKLKKCVFVSIVASFFLLFLITGCQNPFYGDFKADGLVLSSLAVDNPLLKAQVGDWIKLKCSYLLNGEQIEEFIRKEVIKKDETTVTMKTASTFSQDSIDAYEGEEVMALNSWDEFLNAAIAAGVSIEPIERDIEAVKVGETLFQTSREKYKVSFKSAEEEGTMDMTYWVCPEIPLFGVVRVSLEVAGNAPASSTVELLDFGSAE